MTGLTIGLIAGIAQNGFSNIGATFLWGLAGAVLIAFLLVDFSTTRKKKNLSQKRVAQKRVRQMQASYERKETEGAFSERMERFSSNVVQRQSIEPIGESKMPFWSTSGVDQYERSPPKPVNMIRVLLQRIRKIVSGK